MSSAPPVYQPGRFELRALGTSSALSAFGRHLSAQVLTHNQRHFLIDCGEGTQFRLMRFKYRLRRLDAVFISHLHGDHVLGLAGLLCTLSQLSRSNRLPVYGPPGLRELIDAQLRLTHATLNYDLNVVELTEADAGGIIHETDGMTVTPLSLEHRVPCFGYLFREKARSPVFLVDKARAQGLPVEYFHLIKLGNDVTLADGTHFAASDYLGEPPAPCCYAYCSDTRYMPALADSLREVDLLYHEATFRQDLLWQAEQTAHSTAAQAAAVARDAEAGHLLLGHFSARYADLTPLLHEAQAVFSRSSIAEEGRIYPIPYYPDLLPPEETP